MAPLPVAKGEMSPCPLSVDSLRGSCAVICSYKDITKEVPTTWGDQCSGSPLIETNSEATKFNPKTSLFHLKPRGKSEVYEYSPEIN